MPSQKPWQLFHAIRLRLIFILTLGSHVRTAFLLGMLLLSALPRTDGQMVAVEFHLTNGYDVSGTVVTSSREDSILKCALLCTASTECYTASYRRDTQICSIFEACYTSPMDFQLTPNTQAVFLRKSTPADCYGQSGVWHLAFRAQRESDQDVWGSWTDTGRHDDAPAVYFSSLPMACTSIASDFSCDRIYRSQMLDTWANVTQAQIAFFTNGQRVAYVSFDASLSSSKNQFMAKSKVLATSITELQGGYNGPANYFDVIGEETSVDRRFYLSKAFQGCPDDLTWMVVVGGKVTVCGWERSSSYPTFLYTLSGYAEKFHSTEPGRADVFAVFIQLSS